MALFPSKLWPLIPAHLPTIQRIESDDATFGQFTPAAASSSSSTLRWDALERIIVLVRDQGPLAESASWMALDAALEGISWPGHAKGLHLFLKALQSREGFDTGAWIESAAGVPQGVFVLFTHPAAFYAADAYPALAASPLQKMLYLHDRFERLWKHLAPPAPRALPFSKLFAGWSEPHRFYHSVDHLLHCLKVFDDFAYLANRKEEVETGLWYHDVVYNTMWGHNEERSALMAEYALRAAGLKEAASRVAGMIRATHTHPMDAEGDGALLLDIDLSILGAPDDAFDAFERGVRREFRWVPEWMYKKRRANLFRAFLERPSLYLHPPLRDRYETKARLNLLRGLARLES